MATKMRKSKLSMRNKTMFKKSSSCSSSCYRTRETILKKAYELELCEVDVCIICFGRDGKITTWPEDQSKVRDMAERFNQLSEIERRKKSTNLSRFLNKKMNDEKKKSLEENDDKFSEMEASLKSQLRMLQDRLQRLCPNDQTENRTTDLTSSLIVDHQQTLTNHLSTVVDQSRANLPTSPLNQSSNFSLFLYNHENGVFTQLTHNNDCGYSDLLLGAQGFGGLLNSNCNNNNNSDLAMVIPPSSFDQAAIPYNNDWCDYSDLLLGEQGFGGLLNSTWDNNNNDLPMMIPTLSQFGEYASTPSFGDPIFSSYI